MTSLADPAAASLPPGAPPANAAPSIQVRQVRPAVIVNGKSLPLTAEDLQEILPHRGSFALLDRVIEVEPGRRAVGTRVISRTDPVLADHFPGRPIVPGVLIIETLGQLCGIVLWSAPATNVAEGGTPMGVLAGVKKFRFHRLVVPGDVLALTAVCTARLSNLAEFQVAAHVDREPAADGIVQIGFRPA
jgi:3-hydroxyacyl-[acyl-carrier-protein] dehydratase